MPQEDASYQDTFGLGVSQHRMNHKCMATNTNQKAVLEGLNDLTIPSALAPYPARPRLPIVQLVQNISDLHMSL